MRKIEISPKITVPALLFLLLSLIVILLMPSYLTTWGHTDIDPRVGDISFGHRRVAVSIGTEYYQNYGVLPDSLDDLRLAVFSIVEPRFRENRYRLTRSWADIFYRKISEESFLLMSISRNRELIDENPDILQRLRSENLIDDLHPLLDRMEEKDFQFTYWEKNPPEQDTLIEFSVSRKHVGRSIIDWRTLEPVW